MLKKFFRKEKKFENSNDNKDEVLITSLLIHAAKMDENYTNEEKNIIKRAIIKLFNLTEPESDKILELAEKKEKNSNQILEFTKEIKKHDEEFKYKIIEILWRIIFSDNKADMYETNLIRRISGLLYLSDKEVGKIKNKFLADKKI